MAGVIIGATTTGSLLSVPLLTYRPTARKTLAQRMNFSLLCSIQNKEVQFELKVHPLAQLIGQVSHVQRLCPCCSVPWSESWPGATIPDN